MGTVTDRLLGCTSKRCGGSFAARAVACLFGGSLTLANNESQHRSDQQKACQLAEGSSRIGSICWGGVDSGGSKNCVSGRCKCCGKHRLLPSHVPMAPSTTQTKPASAGKDCTNKMRKDTLRAPNTPAPTTQAKNINLTPLLGSTITSHV